MHPPERPIFEAFPALRGRLPWVALGEWPTPVQPLGPALRAIAPHAEAWVKRDDLSSPVYGGNKVRTLEVLFAEALEAGARRVWSTGAFGTNHGTAALLHAPRVGLRAGLVLFPQPRSACAAENLRVMLAAEDAEVQLLPHWSALPGAMGWVRLRRRAERPFVMVPGGATPRGALGYVSAALELALQVAEGALPAPRKLFLGVGSTCTTAGLLLGLRLAARRGIGFLAPPEVVAVRVTPWPVTAAWRIAALARRASELLHRLSGDPRALVDEATLRAGLRVDGGELGRGYGHPTRRGREAIRRFGALEGLTLDTTYSGKAAAGMLRALRAGLREPALFWSTKSTAPLPAVGDAPPPQALARAWLAGAPRRDAAGARS